jgi:hypothetical protein
MIIRMERILLMLSICASIVATTPASGASPYSQWPNGPSTDPNFFPLGVWLQGPEKIAEYKDIGINIFVGFWGALDQTSLNLFASGQMPLIVSQNSVGLTGAGRTWIKSWSQMDEPDNAQDDGQGGYGPCIDPSAIVSAYNTIRANDTTRPVFLNFGQGVANIGYIGRGSVCNNWQPSYGSYYTQASQGGDIVSFDIYPVAGSDIPTPGRLEYVAEGVDNLRSWTNHSKIIWNFIEAAAINGIAPTAAQVKTEVWMSLIHGSQGIMYFVHQFKPTFREDGIFNYPALVSGVSQINAQVSALAPALNSPTVSKGVSVTSSVTGVPIDTLVKQYSGFTYVFSVAMRNTATTATFSLPGITAGTAEVLGEGRQITIANGKFQDAFAGYAVHLYKITPGGDTPPAPPTNLRIQ